MKASEFYGLLLLVLTLIFFTRVLGQVLVAIFRPGWLPPMEAWYSGLIPYPILLLLQLIFLSVMAVVAVQFLQDHGYFMMTMPTVGRIVLPFSGVYFGTMVVRYIVHMRRSPDQRWFGGTIPIVFHCVLATYLFVFSLYHLR